MGKGGVVGDYLLSPSFISGLGLGVGLSVLYVKFLQTPVPDALATDEHSDDSDSAGEGTAAHYKSYAQIFRFLRDRKIVFYLSLVMLVWKNGQQSVKIRDCFFCPSSTITASTCSA